jgi:hypothetical protein
MSAKFSTIIERTLPRYKPEDGETIDIVAFKYVFPSVNVTFWESSLLGCGVGGRGMAVKRKPLKGRIKYNKPGSHRVVILVDSLQSWLTEYNPDNTQTVDEIIAGLKRVSDKHDRYLAHLKTQGMLKSGTTWGKQRGEAPKQEEQPRVVFDTKSVAGALS